MEKFQTNDEILKLLFSHFKIDIAACGLLVTKDNLYILF